MTKQERLDKLIMIKNKFELLALRISDGNLTVNDMVSQTLQLCVEHDLLMLQPTEKN